MISSSLELAPADHQRLLRIAARHERSAAQEVRWAVRQWLDQHEPLSAQEGACK